MNGKRFQILTMQLLPVVCLLSATGGSAAPANCPCDVLDAADALVLRATVLHRSEDDIALLVDELFSSDEERYDDVYPGDVVGGNLQDALPCGALGPKWEHGILDFGVGDQVLAFYTRGILDMYPDCREYRRCLASRCMTTTQKAPWGDGGSGDWSRCEGICIEETSHVCASHREEALMTGVVSAVQWGTEMVLRLGEDTKSIDGGSLDALMDTDGACRRHFPDPEPDSPGGVNAEALSDCAVCGIVDTSLFRLFSFVSLMMGF